MWSPFSADSSRSLRARGRALVDRILVRPGRVPGHRDSQSVSVQSDQPEPEVAGTTYHLKEVRNDAAGSGYYNAPRGDRRHNGIDFVCPVGKGLVSPVSGTVTKLGYCYGDDPKWRYVQVTDSNEFAHRFFYVSPTIAVGVQVQKGLHVLGFAQDITERYPDQGMTPHTHYEVKSGPSHVDPELFLEEVHKL